MRGGTAIGIGRKLTNPSNLFISKVTLIPFSYFLQQRRRPRSWPRRPISPPSVRLRRPKSRPGQPDSDEPKSDTPASAPGIGHGRGRPLASSQPPSSFSSFVSSVKPNSPAGRGQPGQVQPGPQARDPMASDTGPSKPATPIFFRRDDGSDPPLPGGGRGKPMSQPGPELLMKEVNTLFVAPRGKIEKENRYIQARPDQDPAQNKAAPRGPKLTREEAVAKALGILQKDDAEGGGSGGGGSGGGGRGRGRGMRGRGRGRGRGDFRRSDRGKDVDEGKGSGLYLGDNADGEKLAKKLGPENMNKLVEGFEEVSSEVLPSPLDEAFVDAMHTNYMIECEPEFLMGDFSKNPDIDEKPHIPLRDALEKMKPFLMAYEGIKSHEEWEEAVEEVMERVPLLKEIVDHYSGPDRVTAKKQQEELERVAKTLPATVPESVKRFTDRAVLSLQSNPGWGFDRKCQFMDKLVDKVSKHYK
ncbi:translation initiation factor IF-2-like [Pyrus x bretschneideri]|uniref:translation initiation factor IF-2-like n=1 Tax=Pyrus x bretschneideri TaxID=225117 RepID=UPI002030115F|nr:translation initiation factor IF-2-like [Pyrus x bretschneideri]